MSSTSTTSSTCDDSQNPNKYNGRLRKRKAHNPIYTIDQLNDDEYIEAVKKYEKLIEEKNKEEYEAHKEYQEQVKKRLKQGYNHLVNKIKSERTENGNPIVDLTDTEVIEALEDEIENNEDYDESVQCPSCVQPVNLKTKKCEGCGHLFEIDEEDDIEDFLAADDIEEEETCTEKDDEEEEEEEEEFDFDEDDETTSDEEETNLFSGESDDEYVPKN